jgi:hypothetical protein
MTIEDEVIGQEAAQTLIKWEEYVSTGVANILAAQVAQFGYSTQALLTSQTTVTEFIGSVLTQVFNVGTAIAGSAFQLISGRRPTVKRAGLNIRELPPTPPVTYQQRIEQTVIEAVAEIEADNAKAEQVVKRAGDNMKAVASSEVNSTAARASEVTARSVGAKGVIWVAERDACVNCVALSGQTTTFGESFDGTKTWGDKALAWNGFSGKPPRHPHCRCRLIPWDGGEEMPNALKREAERSVLRGWSLPSESQAARIRALDRLLRQGTNLPPSVVKRARAALAAGKFPQGRTFPGNTDGV